MMHPVRLYASFVLIRRFVKLSVHHVANVIAPIVVNAHAGIVMTKSAIADIATSVPASITNVVATMIQDV